ncbi:MAG TPA: VOC family protein [Candidatus Saccharimonadia bacterium]|nr:VOC family protein [Candidatus Saccharimonadia bacterium]
MNSDIRLALTGLGQVAVTVIDLERAVAFYRDVLGLAFLMQVPGMAFFDLGGGTRLLLGLAEQGDALKRSSILYFRVADTTEAEIALRARDVDITGPSHLVARMPDHELWICFFRDSETNIMALMAEKRLA